MRERRKRQGQRERRDSLWGVDGEVMLPAWKWITHSYVVNGMFSHVQMACHS